MNNWIRHAFMVIGRRLKGGSFSIDQRLPFSAVVAFILERAICALRGLLWFPFLAAGSELPIFIGKGVRLIYSRHILMRRGVTLGAGVKISGLSSTGVQLGRGVSIGDYTQIIPTSVMRNLGEGCSIGEGSGIGQFSFLGCGGGVSIGPNVIMGQYVSFHTERHILEDLDIPIKDQGVYRLPISIAGDCWVGAKATFLPGASVGEGAVVAAGAVVRGNIPALAIVGGVPARLIRSRKH